MTHHSFRISIFKTGLALLIGLAGRLAGAYVIACNGYLTPGPNAPLVPTITLAMAISDYAWRIRVRASAFSQVAIPNGLVRMLQFNKSRPMPVLASISQYVCLQSEG